MKRLIAVGSCWAGALWLGLAGCSGSESDGPGAGAAGAGATSSVAGGGNDGQGGSGDGGSSDGGSSPGAGGSTVSDPVSGPFGNPDGSCDVPAAAEPVDVSDPTTVVGNGMPESCTAAAVVDAVHGGGIVTFDCGDEPLTIVVPEIKIFNDGGVTGQGDVTIDGGGLITLSGGGKNRVLYQSTCDQAQKWTTPNCDAQDHPNMVLQNLGIADGRSAEPKTAHGGGAITVQGGTFRAYNIHVSGSTMTSEGQDVAGGGIYAVQLTAPAYIANSTFEDNSASNGGAIGGLFIDYVITNSLFLNNSATGEGRNPAAPGTPGGGLGGAIYNDGNDYTLSICGTRFDSNTAPELGSGAIFQVVNNLMGDLIIKDSTFVENSNEGSVQSNPSIYVEARDKSGDAGVDITGTTFE